MLDTVSQLLSLSARPSARLRVSIPESLGGF